jgi:hypothetical protein
VDLLHLGKRIVLLVQFVNHAVEDAALVEVDSRRSVEQ